MKINHKYKFILFIVLFIVNCQAHAVAQLVFAIDLIRHGDRNPIQDLPKSPMLWQSGLVSARSGTVNQLNLL